MCDIMCAKKKAFALWLTLWLSFERRKIFLETILQMLLICVCRFSCSPTVTPSRRCFKTYSIGVISNFRLKGALCCCFLGCFCLVAINMYFVLVAFSAIRFLPRHLAILFGVYCVYSILSIFLLAALRVP